MAIQILHGGMIFFIRAANVIGIRCLSLHSANPEEILLDKHQATSGAEPLRLIGGFFLYTRVGLVQRNGVCIISFRSSAYSGQPS